MLKRKYWFIQIDKSKELVISFGDKTIQSLSDFFNIEVSQFAYIIVPSLEGVLFHGVEEDCFAGNMLEADYDRNFACVCHQIDDIDDEVGPSTLPTIDLYRLVKEFLYLKKILEKGREDIFPLELDDGQWLI